jgi:hypothetical protein
LYLDCAYSAGKEDSDVNYESIMANIISGLITYFIVRLIEELLKLLLA